MNERLADFFNHPFEEQIQELYRKGTFQISIRYYGYKVNLYLFKNQLLEVFYNHKEDKIESIQPLDFNHTRMKFYTDQISITSIKSPF